MTTLAQHAPGLFEDPQVAQHAPGLFEDPQVAITGTLLAHAEARQQPIDHTGQFRPVLCMDIASEGPLHLHVHIEQPFPLGHMPQCEAAAKRHRKGERITVHAPVLAHRLTVTASHIHHLTPSEPSA